MKTTLSLPLGMWVGIVMTVAAGNVLADDAPDPHAHHHMMMSMMPENNHKTVISTANNSVPQTQLVRDDGKIVSLPGEINDGRPVILNFIYTTCTTVCPLTSRTFEHFQDMLGEERNNIHMVSISIDPEQDTPERLAAYARKYDAAPQWHFYTGTNEASLAAQRAFDVYRGDKMNHTPVTLLRAAPGKSWLRIEGFAAADDLLREYRALTSAQ